jgi:hypothetical protein
VAVAAISSVAQTNENMTLDAKGSGSLTLNGTATGTIFLGRQTRVSGSTVAAPGYSGVDAGSGVNVGTSGRVSLAVGSGNEMLRVDNSSGITSIFNHTFSSLMLSSVTRTIASAASPVWGDFEVATGKTTFSGSTHVTGLIAKSQFDAPLITASASAITIDFATNVYIAGAPTTDNSGGFLPTITNAYALYVNSGPSFFGGGIAQSTTNSGYGITTSHAPTIASAATVNWKSLEITSTLTLTGTTTVSNDAYMVRFGQPLITDSSAVTVSKASTVYIGGEPVGGGSATVTAAGVFALKIASGNVSHAASSYINFGDTSGTTGYGLRDNSGTIECKNSGGSSWAACSASGSITGAPYVGGTLGGVIGNSGAVNYVGPSDFTQGNSATGTEQDHITYVTRAGTAKNLTVNLRAAQPAGGSLVVTVRKNGLDQTLKVTIAAGSTTGSYTDFSDTVSYAQGDSLSWKVVNNSGSTAPAIGIAMEYDFLFPIFGFAGWRRRRPQNDNDEPARRAA